MSTKKPTLMIVDDEPTNLDVLGTMLRQASYEVAAFPRGALALAAAPRVMPDLALLDIRMPDMDGYELCRRFKQDERLREIPVIFLSALSETRDKVLAFEVGAVDYIPKPLSEPEVLARVRTHLTLSRQKRELEKLLEERNRFMRMAIHDLRNPLSAIIGWSELGATADRLEEAKFTFAKVQESANWLNDIINDFLALHQLHNQPAHKHAAVFDLHPLVAGAIEQHRCLAEKKNSAIAFSTCAHAMMAFGSAAFTHQIVSNYLSNAIKYSPVQTEITVSIQPQGGKWLVEVKDQGPGIPQEERTMLFTEFARISSMPTGEESSTRLGLAIVKRLAEAEGGRVGASFPESGGSLFWVEIPALTSTERNK
jgi:signal transduction histidine kinase